LNPLNSPISEVIRIWGFVKLKGLFVITDSGNKGHSIKQIPEELELVRKTVSK
jgi:hypothetical protein